MDWLTIRSQMALNVSKFSLGTFEVWDNRAAFIFGWHGFPFVLHSDYRRFSYADKPAIDSAAYDPAVQVYFKLTPGKAFGVFHKTTVRTKSSHGYI